MSGKRKTNTQTMAAWYKSKWVGAGVLSVALGGGYLFHKHQSTNKNSKDQISTTSSPSSSHHHQNYLSQFPDAQDAMHRLADYRYLSQSSFDTIKKYLEILFQVYLEVHQEKKVSLQLELEAFRCKRWIDESLLQWSRAWYPHEPSKQFLDDKDHFTKIVNNYLYNIRAQIKEKMALRQITV
jgi:hypothetical protein